MSQCIAVRLQNYQSPALVLPSFCGSSAVHQVASYSVSSKNTHLTVVAVSAVSLRSVTCRGMDTQVVITEHIHWCLYRFIFFFSLTEKEGT